MCQLEVARRANPAAHTSTMHAGGNGTPSKSVAASVAALLELSESAPAPLLAEGRASTPLARHPSRARGSRKRPPPLPCESVPAGGEHTTGSAADGKPLTPHTITGLGVSNAGKRFKTCAQPPAPTRPAAIAEEAEEAGAGAGGCLGQQHRSAGARRHVAAHHDSGDKKARAAAAGTRASAASAASAVSVARTGNGQRQQPTSASMIASLLSSSTILTPDSSPPSSPSPAARAHTHGPPQFRSSAPAPAPDMAAPSARSGTHPASVASAATSQPGCSPDPTTLNAGGAATAGATQEPRAAGRGPEHGLAAGGSQLAAVEAEVDALSAMCGCYQGTLQAAFDEAKTAVAALGAELGNLREKKGVLLQHMQHLRQPGQGAPGQGQDVQSLANYASLLGTAEQTLALRHAQEMQQMQELVPRMAEAVAHRSQLNKAKTVLAVLRHEEEELRIARATFEGNVAAVVRDVGRVVQGLRAPRPPLHAV